MEKLQKMFSILSAIEHEDLNNQQFCTYEVGDQNGICTDTVFGTEEKHELHPNRNYVAIFIEYNDECAFEEQDFPPCDYKLNNKSEFGPGSVLLYEF